MILRWVYIPLLRTLYAEQTTALTHNNLYTNTYFLTFSEGGGKKLFNFKCLNNKY